MALVRCGAWKNNDGLTGEYSVNNKIEWCTWSYKCTIYKIIPPLHAGNRNATGKSSRSQMLQVWLHCNRWLILFCSLKPVLQCKAAIFVDETCIRELPEGWREAGKVGTVAACIRQGSRQAGALLWLAIAKSHDIVFYSTLLLCWKCEERWEVAQLSRRQSCVWAVVTVCKMEKHRIAKYCENP